MVVQFPGSHCISRAALIARLQANNVGQLHEQTGSCNSSGYDSGEAGVMTIAQIAAAKQPGSKLSVADT